MNPWRTGGAARAAARELERPPARLRLPLTVFALAVAGLLLAGFLVQRSMRLAARRKGAAEITAVAALKARAIEVWRAEAARDAAFLATNPFVPASAAQGPQRLEPALRAHAERVLENFASRHQYEEVALLTAEGEVILAHGAMPAAPPPDPHLLARALASARPESTLVAETADGTPRLDVAVAVRDGAGRPVAIAFCRRDAAPFLASVVETWPVPSDTGESVVVRPDRGAALFITEPRFLRGWAMKVRIPLSEELRGIVRVLREPEGVFLAVDYRGTPVLIAGRSIPDSDWHLATRMDISEIEAPVLRPLALIAALVLALLAACGAALAAWWRHEVRQHRELARARDALEQSEERFRLALANTQWVWDWDMGRARLALDPQWTAEYRIPSSTLQGDTDEILGAFVHPDDRAAVKTRLAAHVAGDAPVFEAEFRLADPSPGLRWALMRGRASHRDGAGRALRITGVLSDNTERRRLQAQVERAERLAGLGTLAAGVAHEINNPLAYVVGNLDFLVRELNSGGAASVELAEAAAQAREGATRVRDVVRGLQVFSRPASGRRRATSVAEELATALRLADHDIRHRARLDVRSSALPAVAAADHELCQVFLNVLLNAAQAMPEGHAAENSIAVTAYADEKGWARVEVRDTGTGIPPHVLPRIFEPFFTTKAPGGGTGLGLAIAHGIVTGAGGRIEVESQVGRGTLVRVLLPPAPSEERTADGAPAEVESALASARVLVVDDDPLVARSIARALRPAHEVIAVRSGADALARLEREEHFDVFLCDLMMPQMSGMELHERVACRDPELAARFVFITGGAFTDGARAFLARTQNPWVEKPFDPGQLRDVVARMAYRPAEERAP
ncbi:MAG TPA: ATP-binding protein [Anaeromyxobacteraceae bacterium]|nr:ATP-binding protein [Anaeromyxobacteraceae bacterium]